MESRLTNDISPESTPGAGRRRARTPHSFPHVKYTTQMSVPDQAELDKLRQRINFTDMDEVRSHRKAVMKGGCLSGFEGDEENLDYAELCFF